MKKNSKFTDWLEHLEQESWQLELIISGILLVVLDAGQESVVEWGNQVFAHQGQMIAGILMPFPLLFLAAVAIAKTNLVLHIFLRGLWIGCIGLRYVSKEIDIDSLNYSEKFSSYLNKNNKGFDHYLEELEKMCSIIFSFTFLVIFEIGSIFIFIVFILLSVAFWGWFSWKVLRIIGLVWLWVMIFALIFHLLDFITLGFFKRKKILSKIYFPFYRLYDFFSLSFLFRPLYYNFIDNEYGRKYLKFVIPYFLILMIVQGGVSIGSYNFIPSKQGDKNWLQAKYYEDLKLKDLSENTVSEVIIPSIKINENVLPVFLPYFDTRGTEKVMENTCPDLEGYDRNALRIYVLEEFISGAASAFQENEDGDRSDLALQCFSKSFDIRIDSVPFKNNKFYFYEHPEFKSKGIITYLNIKDFEDGNHLLFVDKKVNYRDSAFVIQEIEVPFVKYD